MARVGRGVLARLQVFVEFVEVLRDNHDRRLHIRVRLQGQKPRCHSIVCPAFTIASHTPIRKTVIEVILSRILHFAMKSCQVHT